MATVKIARTLGGRLRDARERMDNMTQWDVANRMGVGQTVIQRYETDQVKNPRKDYLEKFAEIYGVSYSHLVDNPYDLDHIPEEIKEMLYDKQALPFIAEAFIRYQEDKIKRAKEAIERNVR
ncbi:helix-turn-helix domain-containing protein [Sporomusa aerivorans]|uniref:helix-turn-helix domain-containing protein n=1 Tax=Sporomusa aerivorans TaxID=204936 RepID=UPI00352AB8DF